MKGCRLYASRTIGDEKQLLFERCGLQRIRDKWPSLSSGLDTVQTFMWQEDLVSIADSMSA